MFDVLKELLFSAGKGGPNFRSEHIEIRKAVRALEVAYNSLLDWRVDGGSYPSKVTHYKAADRLVRDLMEASVDLPYAYSLLVYRSVSDMWCTAFLENEIRYRPNGKELGDRLQTLYRSRVACHITVARLLMHWVKNALNGRFYNLYLPAL